MGKVAGRSVGDVVVEKLERGRASLGFLRDTRALILDHVFSLSQLSHHRQTRVQQETGHAACIIIHITIAFRSLSAHH
jgi:hypothetical protein